MSTNLILLFISTLMFFKYILPVATLSIENLGAVVLAFLFGGIFYRQFMLKRFGINTDDSPWGKE